jgi:hypothetical protein
VRGVDFHLAVQWVWENSGDLTAVDADAANSIESRFRVHYTAALENDIVALRGNERRQQPKQEPHEG